MRKGKSIVRGVQERFFEELMETCWEAINFRPRLKFCPYCIFCRYANMTSCIKCAKHCTASMIYIVCDYMQANYINVVNKHACIEICKYIKYKTAVHIQPDKPYG